MKKKTIIAIAILIILGGAVIFATQFYKENKDNNNAQIEENQHFVPEMEVYYGKEIIGEPLGYTMEMDLAMSRDVVIPVAKDRKVKMSFLTNDNEFKSIAYSVNSTDDNRLIDNGEIKDFKKEDKRVSCTYMASAIMEPGEEYFVTFKVKTDKFDEVNYYARIMICQDEFVTAQVKFAKKFSNDVYDDTKSSKLALYLEPDLKLPNNNLGNVTINSNYTMLVWSTLGAHKSTDTSITAKEYCIKDNGQAGTYTMDYQVKATNNEGLEETYNVSETITVWSFDGKQYVLAYDREVNQIWEINENNVGNAFLDFGIQNIDEIEHIESPDLNHIAFQVNGDVYTMELGAKKLRPLYKCGASSSRNLNTTKAKVINVDNKGNVDFMVYGYCVDAIHSGQNGINIMRYNAKDNITYENTFIPCNISAQAIEKQISNVCYVGDGTVYIMLDKTIYYVNSKTMEWGTVVENIDDDCYAVNGDGSLLVYNTNGKKKDNTSLTILDLKNGKKTSIDAPAGFDITVCGYTGTNMVYGLAKEENVGKYNFFPISELKIVDENLQEIKSYKENKVYIKSIDINESVIKIERVKNGKKISDDQLLDNTEEKAYAAKSSYYEDTIKLRELALSFTYNLDANASLALFDTVKTDFSNTKQATPEIVENKQEKFYVYGYGKLQDIVTDKNTAIKLARATFGLVANSKGQKIWTIEENYK